MAKTKEVMQSVDFGGVKYSFPKRNRILFAKFENSSLAGAAYDIDSQELVITFKSSIGVLYYAADVPQKVFLRMLNSDSVGAYFVKYVMTKYEFYTI